MVLSSALHPPPQYLSRVVSDARAMHAVILSISDLKKTGVVHTFFGWVRTPPQRKTDGLSRSRPAVLLVPGPRQLPASCDFSITVSRLFLSFLCTSPPTSVFTYLLIWPKA